MTPRVSPVPPHPLPVCPLPARHRLRAIAPLLCWALAAAAPGTAASAAPAAPADCGLDAATIARVDAIGRQMVERGFAPGVVTSLACHGKPVLTSAAGMADLQRGQPMAPDQLFRIYSMSKPITSLAILQLADEGKLRLDDPVARFIPEFADAVVLAGDGPATVAPRRPLTIRDLLRHTAGIVYRGAGSAVEKLYVKRGIDNGGGPVVLPEDGSAPVTTLAELARRIATTPLADQPGERFRYGNAVDVLGRVVEGASQQTLGDYLAARIFRPLGMRDTAFQVNAGDTGRLSAAYFAKSAAPADQRILKAADTASLASSGLALAEDSRASLFARPRAIAFGGAGLVSTAADYQRFLGMMLDGGMAGATRIVSAAAVAEMTRNQLPAPARASGPLAAQGLGFGLGFAIVDDPALAPAPVSKGSYFWGGAASTYMWADPARGLSGVVMTQVFGGDVGAFYIDMLRAIYGNKAAPAATVAAQQIY